MALAEKRVEHELVVLDFAKGDHKQPTHLARQPFGKMPAIEHDGLTLFESRAIARYVGEAFPGASFLPSDSKSRALVDQWVNVEQLEIGHVDHVRERELFIDEMRLALERAIEDAEDRPQRDSQAFDSRGVGVAHSHRFLHHELERERMGDRVELHRLHVDPLIDQRAALRVAREE
jgi:glutathione S-transferase